MADFDEWVEKGKKMGLSGEDLLKFVDKQYEREERRLVREAEIKRLEAENKRLETEAENKRLETEAENKRLETEAENKRLELESQNKRMELEEAERQRQYELEMRKLDNETSRQSNIEQEGQTFKKAYIPKLPPFDDKTDDIDSFLYRFESHATSCGWERDKWPLYIASLLKGSALSLYHSLAAKRSASWDDLKTELLRKFQCTEEGFRDKFRHVRPDSDESFAAYLIRTGHLLDRWIELSCTEQSYKGLRDLILREQILQSVSPELSTFLREREINSAEEMCKYADQYRAARSGKSFARKNTSQVYEAHVGKQEINQHAGDKFRGGRASFQSRQTEQYKSKDTFREQHNSRRPFMRGQRQRRPYQQRGYYSNRDSIYKQCWNCGCRFHLMNDCPYEMNANVCEEQDVHDKCGCDCGRTGYTGVQTEQVEAGNIAMRDTSMVHEGNVLISEEQPKQGLDIEKCTVNGFQASLLRDTGCTTAGVRKSLVQKHQYTGQVQRCRSFGGNIEVFPLAQVNVVTPYYEGEVLACVIERPVTDLILGNLPGVRTARGGKSGSLVHEEALTTTRAQAKREKQPFKPVKVPEVKGLNVKPSELIELQKDDSSLDKTFDQIRHQEGVLEPNSHCFILREGILTRVFQEGKDTVYQIVVPKKLRQTVLQVAHDLPMSGHFGVRRTLHRVLTHFYWPTVRKDVTAFCKSCDICQRTVPKGRIPCAPLQPMPLISEPFQRVAIDLIGPIHPVSSTGHTYILTIVDVATRYPEAIPLKRIDSITIAEALVSTFCRMGCPTEILSDCGTQLISDVMKEVHRLLGIKAVTTTPYHPQSNGLVERFNGTIKAMLKKVVQDQPKDWDRMIPAVLFAYRELPNISTGFSPFELMFGRQARGPMYLLAHVWSDQNDKDQKNLYQYVFELKNRLDTACTLAKNQVAESAEKYKAYADKKAKVRTFQAGDKVLVLLSDEKNKLMTKWKGPYQVTEKTSSVDYKIDMDGQLKIFHVNMLKGYVERKSDTDENGVNEIVVNASVGVCTTDGRKVEWKDIIDVDYCAQKHSATEVQEGSTQESHSCTNQILLADTACVGMVMESEGDIATIPTIPSVTGETVSDVHISSDLDSDTVTRVEDLLLEFADILTDKPGKAVGVEPHCIVLTDNVPIRKKPYPLPFSTRQTIEKEVKYMLELGVIEPSKSAFSAPVVLVSKPDGTVRFCVDYRALNAKTVFDSEPIPDMDELFCALSKAYYFVKIDLTKGYWQIPISEEDKDKTAFQTPFGLFQWTRMPFGLQNAPATFARVMRQLELHKHSAVSFFDDILIYVMNVCQLLTKMREVLCKLRLFGLCARPTKMFVGFSELDFLGHRLARGKIKPQQDKVEKIVNAKTPQTKRQVRALLGLMGYYRRYVPDFASKASALTDLTKDSRPRMVKWTEECQKAVEDVQHILLSKPVLALPDLSKEFVLRTDASATGMGGVLLQERDDLLHPVQYISRKFSDTQLRYSTVERECLAIVWALTKFARFLLGREFVLQTDHKPLTFLKESKTKNNRLLRWALIIQEFRFVVRPISGKLNVLADMLSRV